MTGLLEATLSRSAVLVTVTLPPLLAVLLTEHLILNRVYGQRSALDRIRAASATARTDLAALTALWAPIPGLLLIWRLLSVPGLALIALQQIDDLADWDGLLHGWIPEHVVAQFVIWLLLADFCSYAAHRSMHAVPQLWRFHRFHHAATEMNIITGNRVSFGERGFNQLVEFVVLAALVGVERPGLVAAVWWTMRLIELIQHSDLPWSFGVIAGPRFHRMHHSSDPKDYDANYGNIFTFWDVAFGTVSDRYRTIGPTAADYVRPGLNDSHTEHFENRWWRALLAGTWVDQLSILRSGPTTSEETKTT